MVIQNNINICAYITALLMRVQLILMVVMVNPTWGMTSYLNSVPDGSGIQSSCSAISCSSDIQIQAVSTHETNYSIMFVNMGEVPNTVGTMARQTFRLFSCGLTSAGKTAEACNNTGTPSSPADDYITFSLNPTGSSLGATYTVSVNNGDRLPPGRIF